MTDDSLFGPGPLPWHRLDVQAILFAHGLMSVTPAQLAERRALLDARGYERTAVDCGRGFHAVLEQLNALLRWEAQFGYRMEDGRSQLDALRDGFELEVSRERGLVLELEGIDVLYREHPDWVLGLLSTAAEHCVYHLLHARRFFTLLILEPTSPLVGERVTGIGVPPPP